MPEPEKKPTYEYSPYEERVMSTLENAFRPLTTRQVSEHAEISYGATASNLTTLLKKNKVKMTKQTNKVYWEIK